MLGRAPYTLSFLLVVCCWFRHNAAIPFASRSSDASRMRHEFKDKETDSQRYDITAQSRAARKAESSDSSFDGDSADTIHNIIKNQNVNMNMNILNHRGHRNRLNHKKGKQEAPKKVPPHQPYNKSLENTFEEKESANCSSGKKENQRYSSSFGNVTSHTLNVDKEFKDVVGNNSKAKTISSVHEDEDITLCWIETTTIKENKTARPSKKLVIREYTISFENSATIPDKYLECKKLENELTTNDNEIGKTALFEVIDEDTKVSRVVNFTSVSHVGDVIVWQHKKVKCGVGPVVSKNIIEWNDNSRNPKKRVEIKVSPKMHQLTATNTEEEPCTESSAEDEDGKSSRPTDATTESCENAESGTCEVTTNSNDISMKSTEVSISEEITESSKDKADSESESEEDLSLSTGITKPPTSPSEEISTSTVVPQIPITKKDISSCEEDSSDSSCTTQKNTHSSSSEELSIESDTTEETTRISTPTVHKKIVTKKDISSKEELSKSSSEEKEIVSDLVTEEPTLPTSTTEILIKSSEARASQSTDKASVTTPENIDYDNSAVSTPETSITTSRSVTEDEKEEEHLTSEEDSEDTSAELTSEELNKIDHVPSSSISTITSEINAEEDVTTTAPPYGFTEFVKESEKISNIFNKLSESSISTESISDSVTTQSSSTLKEVSSEESGERVVSEIEGLPPIGQKTIENGTSTSTFSTTTSSITEIKPTALSSTESNGVDYSCENSEDCAYVGSSEACDESSENCGSVTAKSCESGICSEEETVDDQSISDTVLLPTKSQSFVTDSQSSEKSATIEYQHTTVASVATTVLTAQEAENNSTATNNVDMRRSTTTSTPRHKLTLKVKVLLEHINEKKEKHNLVEVEKHLSLNENSVQDDHPELLEQLKSLNDSVNRETLSAILNCTSLGDLTKKPNLITIGSNEANDNSHQGLEFTNPSALEDLISEESTSGRVSAENEDFQYPEYYQENDQENEISSRRRRRRSLDDKIGDSGGLDIVRKNLIDPDKSSVAANSLNASELQNIRLTKETIHPSTTTNNPEEETSDAAYTENERYTTEEGNDSVAFSTIRDNDTDSSTLEYQDVNVTRESIQLSTTTNNPEEETSDTIHTENGNDTTETVSSTDGNDTTETVLSTVPSIKENVGNETKIEVARQTLPGIQEDVTAGLQHVVSELTQNNLTSVNDIKKIIQTNLLGLIVDPKDNRIHSRVRRAAAEEVGHWSNERIRKAPMGGSLRSFTEFTLYKVLP